MKKSPLVLVLGLVACASTSPRVEHVDIPRPTPASSPSIHSRLLGQPVEGYVVVASDIVLHRTKEAAARSTQLGEKTDLVNLRVVKDHGDAIEVSTRDSARTGTCAQGFAFSYELRMFVPRSALRLVVRDYVLEQYDDETGFVLEPGTPVDLRAEGPVPDVRFVRDTGYVLAETDVGFSFRAGEKGPPPPTLKPIAEATCEAREQPSSLLDGDRTLPSSARAKEPAAPPSKPKPRSDAVAAELQRFLEVPVLGSVSGLGQLGKPPPSRCRLELGSEVHATFAGKAVPVAEELGSFSPKLSRAGAGGFVATVEMRCATVRLGLAKEDVTAERRGERGGLGGVGGRGGARTTKKVPYLRKGAVATWPDGAVAAPILVQLPVGGHAEDAGDRVCLPVHNLAEKLCHAKADLVDVEVPAY